MSFAECEGSSKEACSAAEKYAHVYLEEPECLDAMAMFYREDLTGLFGI